MKILLDTNFLLLPFQKRIDVFGQMDELLISKCKYLVLKNTINELKALEGKAKREGKLALSYVEKKKGEIEVLEAGDGKTDKKIIEVAKKMKSDDFFVGTLDADLRKKLKKEGIGVIFLRGKSHLEIG